MKLSNVTWLPSIPRSHGAGLTEKRLHANLRRVVGIWKLRGDEKAEVLSTAKLLLCSATCRAPRWAHLPPNVRGYG